MHHFASPESGGDEPTPDNVIINGIGQGFCHDCNYEEFHQSDDGPTLYRFINAATFGAITVSIDNHYFVVVEVDGEPVHPEKDSVDDINDGEFHELITHIRIDIGQRYSALVFPKDDRKEKSYWMRAQLDNSQFPKNPKHNISKAIVSYKEISNPHSKETTDHILTYLPGDNHINPHYGYFRSIHKDAIHVKDRTVTEYIDIDFHNDEHEVNRPFMDGRNCKLPHKTNYLALALAEYEIPQKSCLWLDYDDEDIVRIVFQNFDDDEHPLHLHGHKFWVLGQGNPNSGPFNAHEDHLNLEHPVYRDTATINGLSYLVVQFVANNPGIWFFHCHIDWHMNIGMGFIISVDVDDVVERLGTTEHLNKCQWY